MGLKLSVIKQDVDDDYVYSPVLVQFQYNQFYRKLTLQYHNILAKFKSQYYFKLSNYRKPYRLSLHGNLHQDVSYMYIETPNQ